MPRPIGKHLLAHRSGSAATSISRTGTRSPATCSRCLRTSSPAPGRTWPCSAGTRQIPGRPAALLLQQWIRGPGADRRGGQRRSVPKFVQDRVCRPAGMGGTGWRRGRSNTTLPMPGPPASMRWSVCLASLAGTTDSFPRRNCLFTVPAVAPASTLSPPGGLPSRTTGRIRKIASVGVRQRSGPTTMREIDLLYALLVAKNSSQRPIHWAGIARRYYPFGHKA